LQVCNLWIWDLPTSFFADLKLPQGKYILFLLTDRAFANTYFYS
jgi:hypothetical protein